MGALNVARGLTFRCNPGAERGGSRGEGDAGVRDGIDRGIDPYKWE